MTIQELKDRNAIVLECISGSKAYGLDLPSSDTDIKGVFVLPKEIFYGLTYIPQVNDESNDVVYYELGRFVELLLKNNPNILELLSTPKASILYKHPKMDYFQADIFLSKLCKDTFAGYALTQIRKARGLNKKISNPMDKLRKTVLDFCYISQKQGAIALSAYLKSKEWKQENCGLVKIPHMRDIYGLYYDEKEVLGFKGIVGKNTKDTILLSSIPKDLEPLQFLAFNKDGYKKYCKDYKSYWDWVAQRNVFRYENTVQHGKNYDAKNMMHTFRLLDMAAEILEKGEIKVRRPNREFLLNIRKGSFMYADLIQKAEKKLEEIESLYQKCNLPDRPNTLQIEKKLVEVRTYFYDQKMEI